MSAAATAGIWGDGAPAPPDIVLYTDVERTNRHLVALLVHCETPVEASREVARLLRSVSESIDGHHRLLTRAMVERERVGQLLANVNGLEPTESVVSEARRVVAAASTGFDGLERAIRRACRTRETVQFCGDALSRAVPVWESLDPEVARGGWYFVRCLLRDAEDPSVEPVRALATAFQRMAAAPEPDREAMVQGEMLPALRRCAEHYGVLPKDGGDETAVAASQSRVSAWPAEPIDPTLRPVLMALAEMLIEDLIGFPPKE
jgi:hypothetical protein